MSTRALPKNLQRLMNDSDVTEIDVGRSSASVYQVRSKSEVFYLKVLPKSEVETFLPDVDRLNWLKGKLPVPKVLDYQVDDNGEFLLLSEVVGLNGVEQMDISSAERLTQKLAEGLKQIHAVDIQGCPLDECTASKLQRAKTRVLANAVDETDFDEERMGMTAAQILQRLVEEQPTEHDLVLNHGDYCLPNVMFNQGVVCGFIDLDRAGVADRYNDLAIASRSIVSNLGARYEHVFFKAYGLIEINDEKIQYFRMMDEMF